MANGAVPTGSESDEVEDGIGDDAQPLGVDVRREVRPYHAYFAPITTIHPCDGCQSLYAPDHLPNASIPFPALPGCRLWGRRPGAPAPA